MKDLPLFGVLGVALLAVLKKISWRWAVLLAGGLLVVNYMVNRPR